MKFFKKSVYKLYLAIATCGLIQSMHVLRKIQPFFVFFSNPDIAWMMKREPYALQSKPEVHLCFLVSNLQCSLFMNHDGLVSKPGAFHI